jgi:hypothetical protein
LHAGTARDRLLGPYYLPLSLTESAPRFPLKIVPQLLQDVDVQTRIHL